MPPKTATKTAPAPVAVTAPAPAAKVAAPAKPASAKKAAVPLPAPAPVVVPEPIVTPVEMEESDEMDSVLISIAERIATVQGLMKEIGLLVKVHQKGYTKIMRATKKAEKKRAMAKKSPSGFAKPSLLSDELCAFLGVPAGTCMARTQVTKQITSYVKSKDLLGVPNKRVINPDQTLKVLLRVPDGEQVTFFNLQKYMKHLFVKPVVAAVVA